MWSVETPANLENFVVGLEKSWIRHEEWLGYCNDTTASCMTLTGPVSYNELHKKRRTSYS